MGKKGEWCGHFNRGNGRCGIPVDEGERGPSSAVLLFDTKRRILKVVVTDPLEIVSTLSFVNPEMLGGDKLPEKIVLRIPDEATPYYRCLAANCRSCQEDCSLYEKKH